MFAGSLFLAVSIVQLLPPIQSCNHFFLIIYTMPNMIYGGVGIDCLCVVSNGCSFGVTGKTLFCAPARFGLVSGGWNGAAPKGSCAAKLSSKLCERCGSGFAAPGSAGLKGRDPNASRDSCDPIRLGWVPGLDLIELDVELELLRRDDLELLLPLRRRRPPEEVRLARLTPPAVLTTCGLLWTPPVDKAKLMTVESFLAMMHFSMCRCVHVDVCSNVQ